MAVVGFHPSLVRITLETPSNQLRQPAGWLSIRADRGLQPDGCSRRWIFRTNLPIPAVASAINGVIPRVTGVNSCKESRDDSRLPAAEKLIRIAWTERRRTIAHCYPAAPAAIINRVLGYQHGVELDSKVKVLTSRALTEISITKPFGGWHYS